METPEQEFCQHALIVHKSEDIGKQRRSLKWLEEFSRHPNCWRSVLKVLSINWSPAAKQEIVWGQAATVRAHLNAGAYCNTAIAGVAIVIVQCTNRFFYVICAFATMRKSHLLS